MRGSAAGLPRETSNLIRFDNRDVGLPPKFEEMGKLELGEISSAGPPVAEIEVPHTIEGVGRDLPREAWPTVVAAIVARTRRTRHGEGLG
jgi:hypothetical protein